MGKLELTPDIIHAIFKDRANDHMRAAGRSKWSREDYNAAVRAVEPLWIALEASVLGYDAVDALREKNENEQARLDDERAKLRQGES